MKRKKDDQSMVPHTHTHKHTSEKTDLTELKEVKTLRTVVVSYPNNVRRHVTRSIHTPCQASVGKDKRNSTRKKNRRKREEIKYINTTSARDTFTSSNTDFPTGKHNTIPIERTSSSVYTEALEAASSFQSSIAMIPVGPATEGR